MASTNDVRPTATVRSRQSAVQAVLKSATFSKNPRLSALLEYLCVRSLKNEGTPIKEYSIATDVFGRPADFDQSTDAIVRVEMHRLRKKLKEFYVGEGSGQPIEIVIQNGHYRPDFVVRQPAEQGSDTAQTDPWTAPLDIAPVLTPTPPARKLRNLWPWSAGILTLLLLVVVSAIIVMARKSFPSTPITHQPKSAQASLPVAAAPIAEGIRILCGQTTPFRDILGRQWGADAFYSGGTAAENSAQPIYRTHTPRLFRAMRSGEFSYKIPLSAGQYELHLYFADMAYAPGLAMEGGENVRVFDVMLNGRSILRMFDIVADAGPHTADIKIFKNVSPGNDGFLHLSFHKETDVPLLNAIEILPGVSNHSRPVRLVTQDSPLTDHNGRLWLPDDYFLGGRSIARYGTVAGPEDPQLYERERYGNFTYAIPVAMEGIYAVKLFFAESYFGPNGPGGGGVGSRLFDVYCNGLRLMGNLDLFKEAGMNAQLIKTFHHLQPNAQGKLLLSFIPSENYANISAIEVTDETPDRQ